MTHNEVAILLIGFERFDSLKENLLRCMSLAHDSIKIYVSLDGPREASGVSSSEVKLNDLISVVPSHLLNSQIYFRQLGKNLGCDKHIPNAIDWVLEGNQGLIVIEDDVRLSPASILEIKLRLLQEIDSGKNFPVIGMSGLSTNLLTFNLWRTTHYFSAWGYGLTANFWASHKAAMSMLAETNNIDKFLDGTMPWSEFSKRKKQIWRERLTRGNYDYKIQATVFKKSIKVSAPILRITDNIGHGSDQATHTRHPRPRYLKRQVKNQNRTFKGELSDNWISSLLLFADSNTWAGDGLLTSRGRTIGVRSALRRALTSVVADR